MNDEEKNIRKNLLENRPYVVYLGPNESANYCQFVEDIASLTAAKMHTSQREMAGQICAEVREQMDKDRSEHEAIRDNLVLVKIGRFKVSLSILGLYVLYIFDHLIKFFKGN
jgi:hypothetical protein